jgi:hypothetical protein
MKQYWEIPGPNKAPQSPCIAFYKYDGSCIRAEWSRKGGWNKFGSRHVLLDVNHPQLGGAIPLFLKTYADDLERVIKKNKLFRGVQTVTVFCEYYGPNSFAGLHEANDDMAITLFDVNLHKKGLLTPRDFLKSFGHLDIAEVVYEGNFGPEFIKDIRDGKYPVGEGVVAKGVRAGKKNQQHGIWMAKAKTKWWMDTLKQKSRESAAFRQALADNMKEQGVL